MKATLVVISLISVASCYPDLEECRAKHWDLGDETDPNAPPAGTPIPLAGQRVYIWGPNEFCINLPDPDSQYLKDNFYSQGKKPSIVEAEGYVRSFCYGDYIADGSLPMPVGGIISAHVIQNFETDGANYYQIYGQMDCDVLNINCVGSYEGAYDDGGQYDSVPFRKCGKEPYSGVDGWRHPESFNSYVEQAGDGIYCMRVCQGGTGDGVPCSAKHDEAGCYATMGISSDDMFSDGFTF